MTNPSSDKHELLVQFFSSSMNIVKCSSAKATGFNAVKLREKRIPRETMKWARRFFDDSSMVGLGIFCFPWIVATCH